MVDGEYSMDAYKSAKTSMEIVMKNPEMLKFVPDYHKTKKFCKHAVTKLSNVIRYVPDQYEAQQMHDKASLENDGK